MGIRGQGDKGQGDKGDKGAEGQRRIHQLPITNYQLPITNHQLPTTNYQQMRRSNELPHQV
ncbi:hypothetical protein [Chroococcidiopsis cubana]|uniref:hypothetical protein n=1 Tax=Chroococcidiopsis cubana TaxID=171392 RepID=UPI002ACDF954|nr:hypothetical protein [Chroococcidiopsis cubana]